MNTKLLTALLLIVTSSQVFAERPSINALNTRVNQLEAENNAQQAEIDALRTDVDGIQAILPQLCEFLTNPAPDVCIKRVFLTDGAPLTGDFGGAAGADAVCQLEAELFSLGGTWKAWVSDSASSPSTTFYRAGKYVDLEGVTIASGWADLTDGDIDAPINFTSGGNTLADFVWTGTDVSGDPSSFNCSDWTDVTAANGGGGGLSERTNNSWTNGIRTLCEVLGRFYCFEQ